METEAAAVRHGRVGERACTGTAYLVLCFQQAQALLLFVAEQEAQQEFPPMEAYAVGTPKELVGLEAEGAHMVSAAVPVVEVVIPAEAGQANHWTQ